MNRGARMPDPSSVTNLRIARNAARARFDNELEQVKQDLEARSVPSRIAGRLQSDAKDASVYALDVISDSKGVVGGTVAALGIWFFREPITTWVETQFGNAETPDDVATNFEDLIDE